MRTIKFRGRREDGQGWAFGIPIKTNIGTYMVTEENPHICSEYGYMEIDEFVKVEPESVEQYTDVDDVDGNPIFEGDIVETFAIYLEYQQVGNYPPPNIEVEEWAVKRSVDAVKFSYGTFDINGFPIMFEDMMCDDDEVDKSTERKEFEDMWEDNSYDIRDKYPYLTWDYFRKPHIIGNIHDNPDLLNGK